MIICVVFVGAMSTGKSTITELLAKEYNTQYMPEYGREYWEKHQTDRRIDLKGFDEIASEHLRRDNELATAANKFLFVDTNAITTYNFSKDYHNHCSDLLTSLATRAEKAYDLYFLCEDDIPYDDMWDRSGEQKRHWFHKMTIVDLNQRKIPFIRLSGSLDNRIKKVGAILSSFRKYRNIFDYLSCR